MKVMITALAGMLRKGRGNILRFVAGGLVLGLFWAFGSTPEYTSSTKILPYSSASSVPGLSSLAGLAGVRLPAGATDPSIRPDVYPELVNTTDFLVEVAETPLRFATLQTSLTGAAYFDSVYSPSPVELLRRYTTGLPSTLRKILPGNSTPLIVAGDDSSGLPGYSRQYLETLEEIHGRIGISLGRLTGVISITGTMPDPIAAAELTRSTSATLRDRIIQQESQKYREQVRFVETQQKRARARLDSSQNALAAFMSRNRASLSPLLEVEADRLRSDRDFAFQIHQQLSTELEQARIRMSQNTPVFAILETPAVPPVKSSPRRMLILVGCLLVSVLAGGASELIRQWWKT